MNHPTEGKWQGASGAARCRIGDISIGGCFIFTQAMPVPGDTTIITIEPPGLDALTVSGHVVYVEVGMGFSVRFQDLSDDQANSLRAIVDTLSSIKASA